MNFIDYQQRCLETAIYPDVGKNFIYPVLGLVEEWAELYEILEGRHLSDFFGRLRKELGDMLWYIAVATMEFGIQIEGFKYKKNNFSLEKILSIIQKNIIAIVRETKRIIRDDRYQLSRSRKEVLKTIFSELLEVMEFICQYFGLDILEVIEKNLEMLAARKLNGKISGSGDNR